ncbi:MAG: VCBS repeat-containing protein, partial [Deltaproteobacteria bacterium]|nr:VCBS repeat-containing protein [Deltaproteobacteria bacterium]
DIVVSNGAAMATPGLQVFTRATPSAAFAPMVIPDAPSASHVVVGDLDGDGIDEIFSGERNFGALVAYWTWTGSAFEQHVISTAFLSTWTHRLELADMDSDGDLDLVVAFGASVAVRWFENVNGTDTGWVSHLVTAVGARAEGLAAADYDQDGDTDLVVAHEGDSEVILYKNDGVAWWRPSGR